MATVVFKTSEEEEIFSIDTGLPLLLLPLNLCASPSKATFVPMPTVTGSKIHSWVLVRYRPFVNRNLSSERAVLMFLSRFLLLYFVLPIAPKTACIGPSTRLYSFQALAIIRHARDCRRCSQEGAFGYNPSAFPDVCTTHLMQPSAVLTAVVMKIMIALAAWAGRDSSETLFYAMWGLDPMVFCYRSSTRLSKFSSKY